MLLSNSISIIPWAPQTPSSLLSPLCFSSKIERKCLLKQVKLSSGFNSERSERTLPVYCSPSQAAGEDNRDNPAHQDGMNFWRKWQRDTAEMRSKIAKLGLAAVLAYGIIDGITYTTFFILAFLGYEKSTGKNPAANIQALLGIVILMWTGNNVTRPFRVAGAAALAPIIDKGLKKIQKYFNFPSLVYAFAFVVAVIAGSCFTVVGLLILSRWGK